MTLPYRRSPLALAILGLLVEAPMHPYEMQRLIKQRGKDRVINVGQRASLYKTINRLRRDGLIAARESVREALRPERTVYEVTDAGRETVRAWMRDMLCAPRDEFPEFPAALSYLPLLAPDDALGLLEQRRSALSGMLAMLERELASALDTLPRLVLLEEEYRHALLAAELVWVSSLVEDLRSARLTWSAEWLAELTARFSPTTT